MDDFYESYNKWYVVIDDDDYIIDAWSDGPHYEKDPEAEGAILVNDKGCYQFAIGGEENPLLFDSFDDTKIFKHLTDKNMAYNTRTNQELKYE